MRGGMSRLSGAGCQGKKHAMKWLQFVRLMLNSMRMMCEGQRQKHALKAALNQRMCLVEWLCS